jgi:hypothetical protein
LIQLSEHLLEAAYPHDQQFRARVRAEALRATDRVAGQSAQGVGAVQAVEVRILTPETRFDRLAFILLNHRTVNLTPSAHYVLYGREFV